MVNSIIRDWIDIQCTDWDRFVCSCAAMRASCNCHPRRSDRYCNDLNFSRDGNCSTTQKLQQRRRLSTDRYYRSKWIRLKSVRKNGIYFAFYFFSRSQVCLNENTRDFLSNPAAESGLYVNLISTLKICFRRGGFSQLISDQWSSRSGARCTPYWRGGFVVKARSPKENATSSRNLCCRRWSKWDQDRIKIGGLRERKGVWSHLTGGLNENDDHRQYGLLPSRGEVESLLYRWPELRVTNLSPRDQKKF